METVLDSPPMKSSDAQFTDPCAVEKRPAARSFGQIQLSDEQWQSVANQLLLTDREQSVIRLLFDCLTRQQIAEQLGIGNRTVRHHMEQIHTKLGVKNRVGVVLKIIQQRDVNAKDPSLNEPSPLNT